MNKYGYQPYTYYLYHIPTGKKYYGARWANECAPEQDLWNEYFSSSELVDALIEQYGKESFQVYVQKTFETAEEARYWEDRVLHKLRAPEREDWLNRAYSCGEFYNIHPTPTSFKAGEDHIYFGKKRPNHGKFMEDWWEEKWKDPNFKHPLTGIKHTSERNANQSKRMIEWHNDNLGAFAGKNNPMYGRSGELHPLYGTRRPTHSAKMKGNKNAKRRPVKTPLGEFNSGVEAAKAHGITPAILCYRCQRRHEGYEYLSKES